MEEYLWYNSCVTNEGKPYINVAAMTAGIRMLKDITNESGEFLPFRRICEITNNAMHFLQYYGLISCIKKNMVIFSIHKIMSLRWIQ